MKSIGYFLIIAIFFTSLSVWALSPDELFYQKASKCYHGVEKLPFDEQSRAKWFKCAKMFDDIAAKYPKSKRVPDALFSSGRSYRRIYEITKNEDDAGDAIRKFEDLVRIYPKSSLADDALFNVGTLKEEALNDSVGAEKAMLQIIKWYPNGDMLESAQKYHPGIKNETKTSLRKGAVRQANPTGRIVKLKDIIRLKDGNAEKVVLKFSGPTTFSEKYEKHKLPKFTFYKLLFSNTYISRMINSDYSYIGKDIIRDVIPVQVTQKNAELKIVIKEGNHCEVLAKGSLVEIMCMPGGIKSKVAPQKVVTEKADQPLPVISQDDKSSMSARKISVVIDAGHGGKDKGAVGKNGTKEKDIVLKIAKRLGWHLRNKLGLDVNYTRIDDRFVSLDARASIANSYNADLFISIHANAAENRKLDGYQTFFLNNATDKASRRLAARENSSLGKNIDDLEKIILTMMQNINTDDSRMLAKSVHKKVLSNMSKYGLKDRKVKSALFYVLVGSKCPAILVETSFISNPAEEKKLNDSKYQESIAKAISEGVHNYLGKAKWNL